MDKKTKRHLSAAEFERATTGLRMKTELKIAAYRYMVDGLTFDDVASQSNINSRSIQRKVRQIWQLHLDKRALPSGWVTEKVSLPKEEMVKVQKHSKQLLSKQ